MRVENNKDKEEKNRKTIKLTKVPEVEKPINEKENVEELRRRLLTPD